MNEYPAFPATLEEFTAYQESLIGRNLSDYEKEITSVWLGVFNDAADGSLEVTGAIEVIDRFIAHDKSPAVLHFLIAARYWILYAAERSRNEDHD